MVLIKASIAVFCLLYAEIVYATTIMSGPPTLGGVSENITSSFTELTHMITAISYIAGIGFGVSAILKFKQHKENSAQIPIGTPLSLSLIAAVLLYFPTVLGVSGASVFGDNAETAGPEGTIYRYQN